MKIAPQQFVARVIFCLLRHKHVDTLVNWQERIADFALSLRLREVHKFLGLSGEHDVSNEGDDSCSSADCPHFLRLAFFPLELSFQAIFIRQS
ncbi:hypothetical protein A6K76_07280 [Caryophanon latum]|uniref:Uncharacterized protein n=1 Tax=Caryophanon latum TaxID=33977 RepID=A0A1C0YZ25_9BACL|nr:hypothetical protein A6K76_07280 [Caryophanon latum]